MFFDKGTINVFTDASMFYNTSTGESIGCPGAVITSWDGNRQLLNEYSHYILRDATNNTAEMSAIEYGLYLLPLFYTMQTKRVNLFSDSQLCINSLREWIYKWLNNSQEGILYNNSGVVKNQEIMKRVISLILMNGIPINLYHQKGHISENNSDSLKIAVKTFYRSNGIRIDYKTAKIISHFNNLVDINTKIGLQQFAKDQEAIKLTNPVDINLSTIDMVRYSALILNKNN